MSPASKSGPVRVACTCSSVRQGARQLTNFYDARLAPTGLRITQYSVLANLGRLGPISIQNLAEALVMDRTTMGRALNPLEREGLVACERGKDGRQRLLALTQAGRDRVAAAAPLWSAAQKDFEALYGAAEADALRASMARLVAAV